MSSRALGSRLWALGVAFMLLAPGIGSAQINMPDPSLIHGRALPAPELPAGTVTVRVVREAIGNNVVGQEVRLTQKDARSSLAFLPARRFGLKPP